MKITMQENEGQGETEIVIHCGKMDEEGSRLIAVLSGFDKRLTGAKDGRTYLLDPGTVLYFESVDKKTFACTNSEVLEVPLRLYELEERLPRDFFRASKSTIINIAKKCKGCFHLKSLRQQSIKNSIK